MISDELARRARELTDRGAPFVTATVVRVMHPTSVEAGSVALVHGDGRIEGFVGGVCAQHSVRVYSLRTLEDGEPLLLRIMPDPDAGPDEGEEDPEQTRELASEKGAVTVQNPCLSGGTIEVFLEPSLPTPLIHVAGETPIGDVLRGLAGEVGLQTTPDPASPGVLAVVVAAHGRDELAVLRAAVEAGVPYVALVASPKRGAAVIDELRTDGVEQERLDRIESPAGLEIGARTPAEIAVSILARVIEVRRREGVSVERPPVVSATTATDPVCGMTVVVAADTPSVHHGGETFYFCCEHCKHTYEQRLAA